MASLAWRTVGTRGWGSAHSAGGSTRFRVRIHVRQSSSVLLPTLDWERASGDEVKRAAERFLLTMRCIWPIMEQAMVSARGGSNPWRRDTHNTLLRCPGPAHVVNAQKATLWAAACALGVGQSPPPGAQAVLVVGTPLSWLTIVVVMDS